MNTIGERIAQRRKALGLTQKELAEKLHVSDKTVSRWETDKQIPDALSMQDIAAALDMTVSKLYGAEDEEQRAEDKTKLYKKLRKILVLGLAFAAVIIISGLCLAYFSYNGLKNNTSVSCETGEFPMYMLTGYDSSIVEWVEYCNEEGDEINYISALAGETAYCLFYLPRGCEETAVEYSYRKGLRGPVLELNFENLAEQMGEDYYLCYMKFPCEDSFILKTSLDGRRVDYNGQGYAMFVGLCENILFK